MGNAFMFHELDAATKSAAYLRWSPLDELAHNIPLNAAYVDHANKLAVSRACDNIMLRSKNLHDLFLRGLINLNLIANQPRLQEALHFPEIGPGWLLRLFQRPIGSGIFWVEHLVN